MCNSEINNVISKMKDGGMGMSLSFPKFEDKRDCEITMVLYAWLANGWRHEECVMKTSILQLMSASPIEYLQGFNLNIKDSDTYTSFYHVLTIANYKHLLYKLKNVYNEYASLEDCFFATLSKERKSRCNHDIFSKILSHRTGFQSHDSNCSFYRYNLLYYWLTSKYNVWTRKRDEKALLPCNDKTFLNAWRKGLTKTLLKTSLPNTKLLTEKAKELYGNHDFFKMYEHLNN